MTKVSIDSSNKKALGRGPKCKPRSCDRSQGQKVTEQEVTNKTLRK